METGKSDWGRGRSKPQPTSSRSTSRSRSKRREEAMRLKTCLFLSQSLGWISVDGEAWDRMLATVTSVNTFKSLSWVQQSCHPILKFTKFFFTSFSLRRSGDGSHIPKLWAKATTTQWTRYISRLKLRLNILWGIDIVPIFLIFLCHRKWLLPHRPCAGNNARPSRSGWWRYLWHRGDISFLLSAMF